MLKGLVLKKYFIITMLAFIIIFFRQRSYAVDNVYVDDYLSAEAPISAALLGLCNADLHDTKLPVSVIYNPSLLSNLLSPNVSLSKSDLPLKAQYNSLYYSQPFLNGGLGLAYNTLTLDDELFVQTNDAGFIINNGYKVSYSALSLAYARKFEIFKKMFDVGLSLRQLNLAVANTSYSAISPILACLYTFKNTNITLSHSITNFIGGTIGDDKLPMRLKTSANINILKNLKIIPEFEKVDARMDYRLGIKYSPIKLVNIYSGYQPSKISLGFEILYSDWAINYAYQTNSNYFAEKNISSMGVTWNIGYNRKLRMNIYRSEMQNIRKLVDRDENYDSAIVILNNLKKVLHPKSDVDEYDNVVYRIEQLQNLKRIRDEMREKTEAENKSYLEEAARLINENSFDLARKQIEKIDETSQYYEEGLKLMIELEKREQESAKKKDELSQKQIEFLLSALDATKDIFVKIDILEKLINLSPLDEYKNLHERLKKASVNFTQRTESLTETFDINRQLLDINAERATQYLENARKFFKERRYEFAKYEIQRGRDLLKDYRWEEPFMQQIEFELAKVKEREQLSRLDDQNRMMAYRLAVNEDYERALTFWNRVVNRTPADEEEIRKITEAMRKRGIATTVKVSKALTPEERQLIEQLFIQGKQLYIAEKFAEAKEKWNRILQLDPNNDKAKRYLKMVE